MLRKHLELKSISQEKMEINLSEELRRRRFEISRKFIKIWKILKKGESRENLEKVYKDLENHEEMRISGKF